MTKAVQSNTRLGLFLVTVLAILMTGVGCGKSMHIAVDQLKASQLKVGAAGGEEDESAEGDDSANGGKAPSAIDVAQNPASPFEINPNIIVANQVLTPWSQIDELNRLDKNGRLSDLPYINAGDNGTRMMGDEPTFITTRTGDTSSEKIGFVKQTNVLSRVVLYVPKPSDVESIEDFSLSLKKVTKYSPVGETANDLSGQVLCIVSGKPYECSGEKDLLADPQNINESFFSALKSAKPVTDLFAKTSVNELVKLEDGSRVLGKDEILFKMAQMFDLNLNKPAEVIQWVLDHTEEYSSNGFRKFVFVIANRTYFVEGTLNLGYILKDGVTAQPDNAGDPIKAGDDQLLRSKNGAVEVAAPMPKSAEEVVDPVAAAPAGQQTNASDAVNNPASGATNAANVDTSVLTDQDGDGVPDSIDADGGTGAANANAPQSEGPVKSANQNDFAGRAATKNSDGSTVVTNGQGDSVTMTQIPSLPIRSLPTDGVISSGLANAKPNDVYVPLLTGSAIKFQQGSFELDKASAAILKKLALGIGTPEILNEFRVDGHADLQGFAKPTRTYNNFVAVAQKSSLKDLPEIKELVKLTVATSAQANELLSLLRAASIANVLHKELPGVKFYIQGLGQPETCEKSECSKNPKFCKGKKYSCELDRRSDLFFNVKQADITVDEAKAMVVKAVKAAFKP